MGSVSAGAGAGVGDHSGALGENPDAAGRGDRDLCAGEPTGLAVSDERVPGQQAIDHVWVTGQLCHEAVVGRPMVTHVVSHGLGNATLQQTQ